MKVATSKAKSHRQPSKGAGTAQIAIWREGSNSLYFQDVFAQYSNDCFYDFAKPLKILDAPGWSPMIKVSSSEGFFVFTSDDKISLL